MSVQIRFGAHRKLCELIAGRDGKLCQPSFTDPCIRASIRHALADEIDRLLNLIDALDDDPDLEPSLGWTETHDQTLPSRMAGGAWDEDNQQEPQL